MIRYYPDELLEIVKYINVLKQFADAIVLGKHEHVYPVYENVQFDIPIADVNGEIMGNVTFTEDGEIGFVPVEVDNGPKD